MGCIVDVCDEIIVRYLFYRLGCGRVFGHDPDMLHYFRQRNEYTVVELLLLHVVSLAHPEYLARNDGSQRYDRQQYDYNNGAPAQCLFSWCNWSTILVKPNSMHKDGHCLILTFR